MKSKHSKTECGTDFKDDVGKTVKLETGSSWGETPAERGERKDLTTINGSDKDKDQEKASGCVTFIQQEFGDNTEIPQP